MIQLQCKQCGKTFKPRKSTQKLCSIECRAKNYVRPMKERFWDFVNRSAYCWEWTGFKDRDGYGKIADYAFKPPKSRLAHRISFEIYNGQIPEGMLVCHRCDNRACVNPTHLFLGTERDNYNDARSKGRHTCGEMVKSTCKLTEDKVHAIRERTKNGARQIDLAKEYGVDRNTIYRITIGQFWKHLA